MASGGLYADLVSLIEAAGGEAPTSGGLHELYEALAAALSEFIPGTPVLLVHAGTNVTVDNTDHQNPVVAADFPPTDLPAITGALSTVADAPAKAVLTSIIAALVTLNIATNGTT